MKCKHEWVGYIIVYCLKCKILKDFFDGYPKSKHEGHVIFKRFGFQEHKEDPKK